MTKYEIIKQEIKEQIEDNILKPNQVIKSENEMCQCYKVSRVTVRKAIDELCAEGILYRIKGKGCFVREQTDQKRSRIYSFTEAVKNEGKLPGKKQLSLEKKEADAYLADKLQIEEGEEVFEIRSLCRGLWTRLFRDGGVSEILRLSICKVVFVAYAPRYRLSAREYLRALCLKGGKFSEF